MKCLIVGRTLFPPRTLLRTFEEQCFVSRLQDSCMSKCGMISPSSSGISDTPLAQPHRKVVVRGISCDSTQSKLPPPPREDIDFDSLPWNLNLPQHHSYLHLTTTPADQWTSEHYDPQTDTGSVTLATSLHPYSTTPLSLSPANTSVNYGTTIWEGLKCIRSPTSEKALLFRPQMNYLRMVRGARALCLPEPPYPLFMRGLQAVVRANATLLPPSSAHGSKLYVRPMLLGSGQQLGLHPSAQMSLLYYVSPTGSYFKKNKMAGGGGGGGKGLKLHLERVRSRAARGGLGSVKCCGNYAVTLKPLDDAKKLGFDDNLYLELDTYYNPSDTSTSTALEQAVLQELSAANIFLVLKTGEIVTPSLDRGTILPGVTRDSVLVLAKEFANELAPAMERSVRSAGFGENNDVCGHVPITVSERDVRVKDLLDATEVFITGTAAEIVPVHSIATSPNPSSNGDDSFSVTFPHGESLPGGPVTSKLLEMLREVVAEERGCEATKDWLCDVYSSPEEFRGGVDS